MTTRGRQTLDLRARIWYSWGMTDGPVNWLQTLNGLMRGELVRYDLMPVERAREELSRLPVVLAAEACRNSVGCGDEMALLPLLPPETAVAVMFTDLVLFGESDGLHLFRQMVVRGLDDDAYDVELAERTVEVTTTSGRTVRVSLVIDPERAKLYVMTVLGMESKARRALFCQMDWRVDSEDEDFGEDVFIKLIGFVFRAMEDGDLEQDYDFYDLVQDFDEDAWSEAWASCHNVERVALEQELLEPHLEAMARHFAVVADLFEEHADMGVDDVIEGIEF